MFRTLQEIGERRRRSCAMVMGIRHFLKQAARFNISCALSFHRRSHMDFAYSDKVNALRQQVNEFMEQYIYPNEQTYRDQIAASGNPHHHAEIIDELKPKAKALGLWNLFLPD